MMFDPFTDPPSPELSGGAWFSDPPALPEPQGLQPGACADCGGNALVDARYEGTVRCSGCAAAHHGAGNFVAVPLRSVPRSYVVKPWISQSERGALRSGTAAGFDTADTPVEDDEAAPGRWRVITPARIAAPEEYPAAATKLLSELDDSDAASVTYALAEDLKLGRLIESIAVRVPHIGYAMWERAGDGNWTTRAAQIADPYLRSCSVTEFAALACGKPYTPPVPPVKGPCPRCGVEVRWRKDPIEPYAHNRPPRAKGEKIKCLATISPSVPSSGTLTQMPAQPAQRSTGGLSPSA